MSLILDALRKSERTRQQTLSGRVSIAGSVLDRGRVPVPWATLIGLLLIANVIVLAVIFWRSRADTPAPQPPLVASPVVAAPAAPYRPAIRSLAAEAAAVGPNAAAGPAVIAQPAVQAVSGASSASTAQKTTVVAAAVSAAPAPAASTRLAASDAAATDGSVPLLDALPLAFQQSLPALHLDVHGYTSNPAGRFAVINMQRYTKGDTLAAGPTVVAIVPDGVILEYHGQKFLLPRP